MPGSRSPRRRPLQLLAAIGLLTAAVAGSEPTASPGPVGPPHTTLPCRACHVAGTDAAALSCTASGCHARTREGSLSSLHDRRHRRRDVRHAPSCPACHGGHRILSGEALREYLRTSDIQQGCGECHDEAPGHGAAAAGAAQSRSTADRTDLPSCFDCHGHHTVADRGEHEAPIGRTRIASTCGRCHPRQAEGFEAGSHGRAVASGDTLAPTCVSCHASHAPAAAAFTATVDSCGTCHDDPAVLRRTGLARSPLARFRGTFHGLAHAHGITDVATCVSCHGAHMVLPSSDPRSSVSRSRVAATCAGCHPQSTRRTTQVVMQAGVRSQLESALRFLEVLFPTARVRLNLLGVAGLGAVTGVLSGLFGIGGGLLMTPLLLILGIPAAVAVASNSAQIAASAVAGATSHVRRGNVDLRLGLLVAAGGVLGGALGVQLVRLLRASGTFDPLVRLGLAALLVALGLGMVGRSLAALRSGVTPPSRATAVAARLRRLPFTLAFPSSGVRGSALVPLGGGFAVGLFSALFGIAGGFLLLPLLAFGVGLSTRLAVGTALLGIAVTSSSVTFLQAAINHTVDLPLALTVLVGVAGGTRLGLLASRRLRRDRWRLFLALAVLVVAAVLLIGLLQTPESLLVVGVAP